MRLSVDALGDASSIGLGYLHGHVDSESRAGLGGTLWFGYGAEARAIGYAFGGTDAWLAYAVGHLDFLGDAGGMGLELAAGGGSGPGGAQGAALGGVYMGFLWVDIGYAFQLPIAPFERPDWLATHSLSIRVHAPILRHGVREWDEPVEDQPQSTQRETSPRALR